MKVRVPYTSIEFVLINHISVFFIHFDFNSNIDFFYSKCTIFSSVQITMAGHQLRVVCTAAVGYSNFQVL